MVRIGCRPANIHSHVAADHPIQLPKSLKKRSNACLSYCIIGGCTHQHTNPTRSFGLLRGSRQRPRYGAAEQRDELAPLHSITSSARASNVGGTVRPSALAVCRLMTNSNLVDCKTGR